MRENKFVAALLKLEAEEVRWMRERHRRGLYQNSIIAWMNSPEWTRVPAGRSQAAVSGEFKAV